MAIRPQLIDRRSPSLGERCALCKEPLSPGDAIIICPADGTPHHIHCWQANDNRCSAYGCTGSGRPILPTPLAADVQLEAEREEVGDEDVVTGDDIVEGEVVTPPPATAGPDRPRRGRRSKVRTYPASSFSCAQTCLVVAIAIAIVLVAFACFGLWAILDFIVMDILDWHYREPLTALFEVAVLLL